MTRSVAIASGAMPSAEIASAGALGHIVATGSGTGRDGAIAALARTGVAGTALEASADGATARVGAATVVLRDVHPIAGHKAVETDRGAVAAAGAASAMTASRQIGTDPPLRMLLDAGFR